MKLSDYILQRVGSLFNPYEGINWDTIALQSSTMVRDAINDYFEENLSFACTTIINGVTTVETVRCTHIVDVTPVVPLDFNMWVGYLNDILRNQIPATITLSGTTIAPTVGPWFSMSYPFVQGTWDSIEEQIRTALTTNFNRVTYTATKGPYTGTCQLTSYIL